MQMGRDSHASHGDDGIRTNLMNIQTNKNKIKNKQLKLNK